MWDGAINASHLYSSLWLTVHTYERDGAPSKTVGSGTGFVVQRNLFGNDQHKGILITNRHILDPDYIRLTSKKVDRLEIKGFRQPTWRTRPVGKAQPVQFTISSPEPIFAPDYADIAAIDLDAAEIAGGCPELTQLCFGLADAADFDNRLHVGAQVITPGYPSIDQTTAPRPILVSGTIASDPRESAAIGTAEFPECVLCHSFSWGGMSGSPVFALLPRSKDSFSTWDENERKGPRELRLVGVNRGHVRIGGTAEGALTYFAKSTVLGRLLKGMGAILLQRFDDYEDGEPLLQEEVPLHEDEY
ncbi:trypsin-like peptidase domain-containing protein [Streptomyces sp. NPDC059010]|uniref:trypsin-like peptidase domain-containing protein n=1 Tax=Streptomyces sp. NPDC059010 TaxID=3346695 RepID=UPI0036C62060